MGTNIVTLVGRLAHEPELRYTPNGTEVLHSTIAINRNWKNKQTGEYDADFIRFQAFGGNAERIANWLKKGSRLAITGRIQSGRYEKNGVTHYTQDVIVDNFEPLESKAAADNRNNYNPTEQPDFGPGDLPF